MKENKREFGLDLVRALAIVSVVLGHFFLYNQFEKQPFTGISMFLQGITKQFFGTIGVPLFLLLSGYLCVFRKPDSKHYMHIVRILISYLTISIVTYCCLTWIRGTVFSCTALVKGILSFTAVLYAWYIEMYLGLFLLIPFLNMILHSIAGNRKQIWIFLASLLLIASLPKFTNRYGLKLLPEFWESLWILVYYCIGGIIRLEFNDKILEKIKKWKWSIILLCIGISSFNSIFTILFFRGHSYIRLTGVSAAPLGVLLSTAVFLLLYKIQFTPHNRIGWGLSAAVNALSKYSLDIYLFSFLSDQIVYRFAKTHISCGDSRLFLYYIPIVVSSLLIAFALSRLKEYLISFIIKIYRCFFHENSDCP